MDNREDWREKKNNNESDKKENEWKNYLNKDENKNVYYIIKVLIPIDQYQTEYRAFYVGKNDLLVNNTASARKYEYEDFSYAVDDSRNLTAKYKSSHIWAPSYVIKKEKRNYEQDNLNDYDDFSDEDEYK